MTLEVKELKFSDYVTAVFRHTLTICSRISRLILSVDDVYCTYVTRTRFPTIKNNVKFSSVQVSRNRANNL